ncbi:MAG TPA: hypothetical protein VFZ58_03505 [Candidatus Saccharimonadales bacterium]
MKDYLAVLKTGWLDGPPDFSTIREALAAYGLQEFLRFSQEAEWLEDGRENWLASPFLSTFGKAWGVIAVPYHDSKRVLLIANTQASDITRYALVRVERVGTHAAGIPYAEFWNPYAETAGGSDRDIELQVSKAVFELRRMLDD